MFAPFDPTAHEARPFQHANVLRDRVQRDRERSSDVGYARFAIRQAAHDGRAGRVGQRQKGQVQHIHPNG